MYNIKEVFQGVYIISNDRKILATRNLTPGVIFYGEPVYNVQGIEYRSWNPNRSKLAAALLNDLEFLPIKKGKKVLYLGAASGTTISHVSDIIGRTGHVWGVEFSSRSLRDLIDKVSRIRNNVSPILGDARMPNEYSRLVPLVDVIFSDVAQPNQAQIVIDNAKLFLRVHGRLILSIKSRSVDVSENPETVFKSQTRILSSEGFKVHQLIKLEPFEKDHAIAVASYPG
jgi:fibrillarin-like pre-rRNA processing protein